MAASICVRAGRFQDAADGGLIRWLEPPGQRITADPQSGQDLRRCVRDPFADRSERLAPASTAATAANNNEVRVCRTPRGSRGSGTRARYSARPGHWPDQQRAVTGRQAAKAAPGQR